MKGRLLQKDIRDLGQCYGMANTKPLELEEKIKEVILNEQIQAGSHEVINIEITLDNKKYKECFLYLRNGYFKRIIV